MNSSFKLLVTVLLLGLSLSAEQNKIADNGDVKTQPQVLAPDTQVKKEEVKPVEPEINKFTYLEKLKTIFPSLARKEDILDSNKLKSAFQADQIKDFEIDKRLLAIRALTDNVFDHIFADRIKSIKTYIYGKECSIENPIFTRKTPDLTKFNYKIIQTYINLYGQFHNIYMNWRNTIVVIPQLNSEGFTWNPSDIDIIKNTIGKYKSEFTNFYESYKKSINVLVPELEKMECGVKDMLIFFDNISRFHKVYQKAKKDTFATRVYGDLWLQRTTWSWNIIKIVRRVQFTQLWVSLFNEFIFFSEVENDPEYIVKLQKIFLQFYNPISYTKRIYVNCLTAVSSIHNTVNTKIGMLEERYKIPKKPFPNVKALYNIPK